MQGEDHEGPGFQVAAGPRFHEMRASGTFTFSPFASLRARARMINSRVPLRGRPREVYPSPLPSPFPVHLFALLEKTRIDGLPLPCRFVVSRFLVSSSKILSVRISRGISRRHRRVRDYQRPGRNLASGSRFRRLRLIVPCLPYNFARSLPRPVVVSATTGRRVTRMKRAHTGAYSALSRLALETDTAPRRGGDARPRYCVTCVRTHGRERACVRTCVSARLIRNLGCAIFQFVHNADYLRLLGRRRRRVTAGRLGARTHVFSAKGRLGCALRLVRHRICDQLDESP